jgi:hypothetical protein
MEQFFFAVPFRSKAASSDWDRNCRLLSATLRSVLGQSDPTFSVLLACHEVPAIPEIEDSRVSVLRATTPPPTDFAAQMKDKGHKRKLMSIELRRRGGGYFMLTDSDDLVSNRLVAHAKATKSEGGYVIKRGYVYDAATGRCREVSSFDQTCGTCAILRFAPDELPQSLDDDTPRLSGKYKTHMTFETDAERLGRPLSVVPFPAAVYVTGHGENWSVRSSGRESLRRKFSRLVKAARALGERECSPTSLRDEFAFSENSYS